MTSGRCDGQVNVDVTFLYDSRESDYGTKRFLESRYRSWLWGQFVHRVKKNIQPSSTMNANACSPNVDSRYFEISPAPCFE